VRAVNLIPRESRRGVRGPIALGFSPSYAVVGVLAMALALVTIYVLSANTVSDRKAKLATLRAEVSQAQARAASLQSYLQFERLAQTRAQTVRQIAAARFDWYRALSDLSKVVPANTSLQSLTGSVAPGASVSSGTGGGGNTGTLRNDISVPAFQLTGCTTSQDNVARLMSRLRLINGVSRVTLGDSQKQGATSSSGCGSNSPAFDLVVFFQPLPAAGPSGVAAVSAQPVSATTGGVK
jgi:Tfp pilus assembly protein PilN